MSRVGLLLLRVGDLFKSQAHPEGMKPKPDAIRTSLDIPRELHRRVHEEAARKGCSARKLILESIEKAVEQTTTERPKRRLNLAEAILPLGGRKIPNLTNEEIYELIDFP